MPKMLVLILFCLAVSCGGSQKFITEAKDVQYDKCYKIIKEEPLLDGFKEVTYVDTCK